MKLFCSLISVWGMTACHGLRASAPPAPPTGPAVDPPGRVARVSYLEGPVSFKAAGTDEWVAASLNRPLTTGDSLWTDKEARAELTFGSAAIRLDSQTGISFLNFDDHTVQVRLSQGAVGFHVRSIEGDETIEVDTPSAAITLLRAGDYRVEANSDSEATRIVVRAAGLADVAGAAQPFVVRANLEAILPGQNAREDTRAAPPLDAFDNFCETRERRAATAESRKYVAPGVIGWEDLDEHGAWETDPVHGPIWIPRVVLPGWAPYRFGHWVWIDPWGWTWIDEAPWGFAPFHYGRWVFARTRWCWVPGPPRVRVVFAPALVVFVGGGWPQLRYHVHVGAGIGIGWFPLGPREEYIPPYRASRTGAIRQTYVNHRVAGAITTVPEDEFTAGRSISRIASPLSEREAAAVRITGTAAPVTPTRRSVTGEVEGRARAPRPPDATTRRPVVVRQTPAPAPPSFEQRRQEMERNPGRPLDAQSVEQIRKREQTGERQPEYRPVPGQQQQPARTETAPPSAREQRRDRSVEDRGRQESERRRQAIDQEHQRQQQQQQPQRKAEPDSRTRRRQ